MNLLSGECDADDDLQDDKYVKCFAPKEKHFQILYLEN